MPQAQVRAKHLRILQEMTGSDSRRLLVLDRDGVINATIFDGTQNRGPWTLEDLVLLPTARAAVEAAVAQGFTVVVATNQPDISRQWVSPEMVDSINRRIGELIPGISRFYVCPHDNAATCRCRKPAPGMLLDALDDFNAEPGQSWMVGDRWPDIAAGHAAGLRTVLIEDDNSWRPTSQGPPAPELRPDIVASTADEAVSSILSS